RRNRYDLRAWALLWSMALRLAAVGLAPPAGLVPVFVGIVGAQLIATTSVSVVAWLGYRRFPMRAPVPLGADGPAIRSFAVQSTVASGLTSLRTYLPTVLLGVVAKAPE